MSNQGATPSPLRAVMLMVASLAGGPAGDARAGAAAHPAARVEPRPGAVPLASAPRQTTELRLPFEGIWGVMQGMNSGDTHVGYAAYAVDFVPAETLAGALPLKRRRRLADFPCYGKPVLAAADGQVVWAHDGEPDRPPHRQVKHEPGNFVIIQHAPDEYTELRHLRSGSLRVRVGERVKRGQPVAACGNSGNAGTPHLHVGLLGSADPIATRPMRFSGYQVLQRDGSWRRGDGIPAAGEIVRDVGQAGALPQSGARR